MNNKKLVLAFIGLALLVTSAHVAVQSQQAKKAGETTGTTAPIDHFKTILIGKGSSPKWSPDGTKIAFISKEGWLSVTNADGKGIIKKIARLKPEGFDWLSDSELVFWEQEQQRIEGVLERPITRIKKLTLDGREELIVENRPLKGEVPRITPPVRLPDGTVGYYENYFEQPPAYKTGEKRTFRVIKSGKLKLALTQKQMRAYIVPNGGTGAGDIWIESMDDATEKRVTTGRLFSFPELSPDGSKILAVYGALCGMCVVDLQGNPTCIGKESFETGDLSSAALGPPQAKWSPDGKKIAYMYMTGKGEQIEVIASDIYVENPDGTDRIQVTDTRDEYEVYPVWSPDGTRIACTGYYSNKIYIIRIK